MLQNGALNCFRRNLSTCEVDHVTMPAAQKNLSVFYFRAIRGLKTTVPQRRVRLGPVSFANGPAAVMSMQAACAQAGVESSQINYINAHGTGTLLNDAAESAAINRWAGDSVGKIPVSSTKAGIGHLLGAAGAVEAAICLMALRGQWLPPMSTTQTPDPVCQFPLVQKPTAATLEYILSNSFGFGGANATLVFKKTS